MNGYLIGSGVGLVAILICLYVLCCVLDNSVSWLEERMLVLGYEVKRLKARSRV